MVSDTVFAFRFWILVRVDNSSARFSPTRCIHNSTGTLSELDVFFLDWLKYSSFILLTVFWIIYSWSDGVSVFKMRFALSPRPDSLLAKI